MIRLKNYLKFHSSVSIFYDVVVNYYCSEITESLTNWSPKLLLWYRVWHSNLYGIESILEEMKDSEYENEFKLKVSNESSQFSMCLS